MEPEEAQRRARQWLKERGYKTGDGAPTPAWFDRALRVMEKAPTRPIAIIRWCEEARLRLTAPPAEAQS